MSGGRRLDSLPVRPHPRRGTYGQQVPFVAIRPLRRPIVRWPRQVCARFVFSFVVVPRHVVPRFVVVPRQVVAGQVGSGLLVSRDVFSSLGHVVPRYGVLARHGVARLLVARSVVSRNVVPRNIVARHGGSRFFASLVVVLSRNVVARFLVSRYVLVAGDFLSPHVDQQPRPRLQQHRRSLFRRPRLPLGRLVPRQRDGDFVARLAVAWQR